MNRVLGGILVALSILAFLGAGITGYAADALFESDEFAERASSVLGEDAVRQEIATRVTDDLVIGADANLVAVRPLIEGLVSDVVGGGAFQSLFRKAAADVHRAFLEEDQNTATFTLLDIGAAVRGAVAAIKPNLAKKIGAKSDADLAELEPPQALTEATRIAHDVKVANWVLLALSVVFAAAALWRSPDRRRTIVTLGVALAIGSAVCAIALSGARAIVLGQVGAGTEREALGEIWDAFLGDLRHQFLFYAGIGAVVAAAASSLLRPVDLGAPLRRGWELLATTPQGRGWRALRGLALLAVGVIVILQPTLALEIVAIAAGLFLAYAGVSELMRLTLPTGDEKAAAGDRRFGRRAVTATAIAGGLILVSGSLFVAAGGTREKPPKIETRGCNGADAICEQKLDEVAYPATHNAMSAATNPGWLFAQQEKGIGRQLRDGIRALLIDAHYGQPTKGGRVKTDLSDLSAGERKTYAAEIGEDALDAALRIRDRIVNSPTTGGRGVYLCHRFCELGAIPIEKAFGEIRDFLAANPNEVVIVDIEDYVDPADIEAAAQKTGLVDYIYTGSLDPMPTVHEVIESGGRAIMMAEKDAGDVPWYHAAYEGPLQETPYSFKKPRELTDPKRLPKSCKPNRGTDDAPMLLLNHWIDTSPAPRPTNAAKVNAAKPLRARIEQCEEQRGQPVNLIAVDFYREGKLFEVARRLNEERAD